MNFDRFQEELTFSNAELAHRRGDDDMPSTIELPTCEYCGEECAELLPCPWDASIKVGSCCVDGGEEPECECQMSGDLFNPALCEVHNSSSPWNARRRAVELIQMLEAAGCTADEVVAWRKMTPQRALAELKREVA